MCTACLSETVTIQILRQVSTDSFTSFNLSLYTISPLDLPWATGKYLLVSVAKFKSSGRKFLRTRAKWEVRFRYCQDSIIHMCQQASKFNEINCSEKTHATSQPVTLRLVLSYLICICYYVITCLGTKTKQETALHSLTTSCHSFMCPPRECIPSFIWRQTSVTTALQDAVSANRDPHHRLCCFTLKPLIVVGF